MTDFIAQLIAIGIVYGGALALGLGDAYDSARRARIARARIARATYRGAK